MMPIVCPPAGPQRMRGIEAFLLLAVAIVATVVFAVTPLDVTTARIFFRPETPDHWPLATRLPWSALYRLAPLLTAGLVLAALAGLSFGLLRRRPMWRLYGAFILLSVALGPGLLVNAVFKDHWERPRPRDIVQFEGSMRYVPAPLPGPGGGSFPCGHCSVGFLYGLAYWIWRDRRPRAARLALAAALVAGIVLGIGRMAAGAHFLSDVIWSALVVFGVSHIVYYYVLRIPDRHQASDIGSPPESPTSKFYWSTRRRARAGNPAAPLRESCTVLACRRAVCGAVLSSTPYAVNLPITSSSSAGSPI